jgi:hypothetical protein
MIGEEGNIDEEGGSTSYDDGRWDLDFIPGLAYIWDVLVKGYADNANIVPCTGLDFWLVVRVGWIGLCCVVILYNFSSYSGLYRSVLRVSSLFVLRIGVDGLWAEVLLLGCCYGMCSKRRFRSFRGVCLG